MADERLAISQTRYTFTDHLGTPFLQTDATATPVWRVEYEPYGAAYKLRTGTNPDQRLRFPGQEYDEQSAEREYNIFRWYRNGWERYTQADPLYMSPETSLYAYVEDNPITWYDRRGLHREGGPWHPDRPVACSEADDCPTLKTKIGLISRTIASHKKWDAMDLAMGGSGDRHEPETGDWIRAIENCKRIYEKKCRNGHDSCRPCKFVKEAGPVMLGAYIIYKTVEFFLCPPLVPLTP